MNRTDAPFSNAARNLRQIGRSPASWFFALLILGIHALVMLQGGPDHHPAREWFEWFGLTRESFLTGKIWQVLSYGFLHGSWPHVGLNAVFILLVGSRIEAMAGSAVMVKTLFAGILGGAAGHLLLAAGGAEAALLVGISGACIALLLLLTTLSPQSRMMPLPVTGKSLGAGILAAALILALVDPALNFPFFNRAGKMIRENGMGSWFAMGHACHFGGGLAGWILGRWILRPRVSLARLRRDRERREADESRRSG
jgi:membrane associated rhomboid family serine protease